MYVSITLVPNSSPIAASGFFGESYLGVHNLNWKAMIIAKLDLTQ